jgi:hypothetical protein
MGALRTVRLGIAAPLAAALALAGCLALGTGAAAAKAPRAIVTTLVNKPVPDLASGQLTSSVNLGKKFKKARVTDVNISVNFTSNCDSPKTAQGNTGECMSDLVVILAAPGKKRRGTALSQSAGGNLISALTLDDDSLNLLSSRQAPLGPPHGNMLYPPYAGSAQPQSDWRSVEGGGKMKGRWTLIVRDTVLGNPTPTISTLGSWQLDVHGKRG